ncbi:MAG: dihydrodipicolinate synthase family protein [Candidatus Lokiarchaeia archaeon]|nr:dihydrodipicolinate synthase family protein [Candidatus Lokiarchaeia archaeon]
MICNTLTFYIKDFKIIDNLNSILLRHILTNEADSILLFGRMDKNNKYSISEKTKLIELVYKATENKVPIMVGLYDNYADKILAQIENMGKKFGDLNFMISPPITEKRTKEDMLGFFENILSSITSKNHIFLINNPPLFAGNEIDPNLLKSLMTSPNLKGIIDAFYNIKNCKAYIQNLSDEFSIICGMEENSQTFLQLIPLNKRKYSGILSNLSNLVNMYSKLFNFAKEDNLLEILQIQEQINDIRNKIYEIKTNEINENLGLKYAFLYLYKDSIQRTDFDINKTYEELENQIDPISKGRIEATVNYLLNNKQIYKLYFLGNKDHYQFDEIINTFSNIEVLVKQGKVKKIKGPYIVDNNTIYRVNFENNQLVFRFRTSQHFQIEDIIKEKLMYPFLDKTLNSDDGNLRQKVQKIIDTKTGSYLFNKEKPPIIPVSNLIYYDETKEKVPYFFSVNEYIRGKPLFQIINQYINDGKSVYAKKFLNLFNNLGELLGRLHTIEFQSYYKNISNIGKTTKISYSEYIESEFDQTIQGAKRNKIDCCDEIRTFYKDNISLIEEENDFVLLHNDFKSQNIIVKEESGIIKINGIVGFDNWIVGSRAQDFIKIDYWILKPLNNPSFYSSFYTAYSKFYQIDKEFKKKIELYKLLWLLNEFNFESELIRKTNNLDVLSKPSLSLEKYLFEIQAIVK